MHSIHFLRPSDVARLSSSIQEMAQLLPLGALLCTRHQSGPRGESVLRSILSVKRMLLCDLINVMRRRDGTFIAFIICVISKVGESGAQSRGETCQLICLVGQFMKSLCMLTLMPLRTRNISRPNWRCSLDQPNGSCYGWIVTGRERISALRYRCLSFLDLQH